MRPLAFKLTLAFVFVSLIGAALAAFFVQQRTKVEFDRFLFDQDRIYLVEIFETYYRENRSWDRIERVLPQLYGAIARERTPLRYQPFLLVDRDGVLLSGNPDRVTQKAIQNYREGVPIEVDGEVVGWLVPNRFPQNRIPETPERAFLVSVNRSILFSALIAVAIALFLGAFLARTLTRPLIELTNATKHVARGEFGYQVEVRSEDELGDLASSFNQMSNDLEKSNRIRRQMTADIAHDLRTPLSVILGYSEALSDGKLNGTPEIYTSLHNEAGHLSVLIDDLRTLSLADSGELPLNLQMVSPRSLLERTASGMKPAADQKKISVKINASNELPRFTADPEQMARVLGNLASNALRYTPEGGMIELSASVQVDHIEIKIHDNGLGIAPEDQPYIFNRFYRGSKSRQQNGEAGLGLTIAKSLAEAQSGTIAVESEPGRGTTFTLKFPIRR